ncbi:GntR family transcriptional regulator [Bacillus rubiinfantis]|uniref:GntR family transcriptional regulator n=1 Tax=Bacillus rubiinfantis TaxID=1499680 RepID=UPI003CCC5DA1
MHQIIEGIAKKELKPGEALPSVRSLAADLGINLHTVNKAYQQLKQEGFILIHRQKGVVINPDGVAKADETYWPQLAAKLRPLIAEAICREVSMNDFLQACQEIYSEFNPRSEPK